jgi:hypothetical protein
MPNPPELSTKFLGETENMLRSEIAESDLPPVHNGMLAELGWTIFMATLTIRNLFAPLGGVELQIPPRRKSHRPISTFEE